jgi:hypothetical protein
MAKTPTMAPGQLKSSTGKTAVMSTFQPAFAKLRGTKRGGKKRSSAMRHGSGR